jgi:hypothetical protein
MTGLLECLNRLYVTFHLSEPTTEVSAHSARYEEVPRIWPFNATEKLDPDVRELLSMHCSWCVLDYGEAQCYTLVTLLIWATLVPLNERAVMLVTDSSRCRLLYFP